MSDPRDYRTERMLKQARSMRQTNEQRRNVRKNTRRQSIRRVKRAIPPTANDDTAAGFHVWDMWLDDAANQFYMCADATAGAAVWRQIS